jgi:NAD-dependent DNA ligase
MSKNPYKNIPFPEFDDVKEISEKRAGNKIKQIREAITCHIYKYYIENKAVFSKKKYDRLFYYLSDM